jgi:hypothetical protein
MSVKTFNNSTLSTPRSLKVIGIIGGVSALIVILAALITLLLEQADFSPIITYLSNIRVTPIWPQIGLFPTPAP